MSTQAQALRALLDRGEPFIAADCYSALTARIIERVGLPAAYIGGHSMGMMHYAVPDCGVLTPTEQIDQAARIVEAISIPLIADADTLGESVADVHRSIRRYENAGVAGIHVEDEVNPKHSTFSGGLISIEDMQSKIDAAVNARQDPAFVIIARCDELYVDEMGGGGGGSLDEAIKRGKAYAEAGADSFVVPFLAPEDVPGVAKEVPVPISQFGDLCEGVTISLHTGWGTPAAARAHLALATKLFEEGKLDLDSPVTVELEEPLYLFPDKGVLIDEPVYGKLVTGWANRTGRRARVLG